MVENRSVAYLKWKAIENTIKSNPALSWLGTILQAKSNVLFCNTDTIFGSKKAQRLEFEMEGNNNRKKTGRGILRNPHEALLVSTLVTTATSVGGFCPKKIGIISPYSAQVRLISELLDNDQVDVSTIDKYQGRDKDVIIVSLVRSNNRQHLGDILQDCRRLNVAFTRAKCKLIIIGSKFTLEHNDLFREFFKHVHARNWLYYLPQHCCSSVLSNPRIFSREIAFLTKHKLREPPKHISRITDSAALQDASLKDIESIVPNFMVERTAAQRNTAVSVSSNG